MRFIKNKLNSKVVTGFIFFTLLIFYLSINIKINISFYDELIWTWRSYFFDLYVHGDFANPLWQGYESIDQPKLAEYSYGMFLYPLYLSERTTKIDLTYIEFLIDKGFWGFSEKTDGSFYNQYIKHKMLNGTFYQAGDDGDAAFYLLKYGPSAYKMLNVIYYARIFTSMLLSASVVVIYILVKKILGNSKALVFMLVYGLNYSLIYNGLKVHSEALYILLFNSSLLTMYCYFSNKMPNKLLYLTSVLIGLCFSTKLTGIVLALIFMVLIVINHLINRSILSTKKSIIFKCTQCIGVVTLIFILMNPYTFKNPMENIYKIIYHRQISANQQQEEFPNFSLETPVKRGILFLFYNFNSPYVESRNIVNVALSSNYNFSKFGLPLFLIGLIYEICTIIKRKSNYLFFSAFALSLGSLMFYLDVGFERYYAPLIIFVVYYEVVGLSVVYKVVKYIYNESWHRYRRIQNTNRILYK